MYKVKLLKAVYPKGLLVFMNGMICLYKSECGLEEKKIGQFVILRHVHIKIHL